MKIALIRQRYNPYGGAERFVSRALSALQAEGASLTIVTRKWRGEAGQAISCDPFYVGSLWRDWSFSHCVCKALNGRDFDIVQAHERIACCDVFRAGDGVHREWLRQRKRVLGHAGRLAITINPYHHYVLAAERRLFSSARLKAVICISEMVRQDILRYFPIAPDKLQVIYNGVDTEEFHPRLQTLHRDTIRDQLAIPRSSRVFLFVGSGFERKGLKTFIQALAQLDGDAYGVVVGKDKKMNHFKRLAQHAGLEDRVRFLGGCDDVKPFYGCADALVFPTLYEPFGNVALEALASGLPVLTTPSAGAAELIRDGINGYVRDALDVRGFAAAMARTPHGESLHPMRLAAREAAEPYTLEAMSRQMIQFYEQLLTGA